MAAQCTARWASAIPSGQISPSARQAIFGLELTSCYDEWLDYPECLCVCGQHLRKLRTKHGYTLGYHKVNGKIMAFVKSEHF